MFVCRWTVLTSRLHDQVLLDLFQILWGKTIPGKRKCPSSTNYIFRRCRQNPGRSVLPVISLTSGHLLQYLTMTGYGGRLVTGRLWLDDSVLQFFRHIHKNSKKADIDLPCLSICPHISVRLPLDGFLWTWYWANLWKSMKKILICLKKDKNVRHFVLRPKYILLLLAI